MASMYADIVERPKASGCWFVRMGKGSHEIWYSPINGRTFTVPCSLASTLFSKLWPRYWQEDERGAFAAFLARNPEAGDVIPGTGGLRKVR